MKKNYSVKAIALLSISLLLMSSLAIFSFNAIYAQTPSSMTFTSGETINFTTDETMTFGDPTAMQFWSGEEMLIGTNITAQFIETAAPDGILDACERIMIISPPGYIPNPCSWWEIIDPVTGKGTGLEFHLDQGGPTEFHVDIVYNPTGGPIPYPWYPIVAKKKIDIIAPCQFFEVHWPSGWYPEPCTWWELIDPETSELTGIEFHVDWTNESCEFHIDQVLLYGDSVPGVVLPYPWFEMWARKKIPKIESCDYFVVEEPPGWYPEPCTWWELIDPYTGAASGVEFHVDWTNESCEFHIDQVLIDGHSGIYVFEPYPVPFLQAIKKVENITRCDWYVVVDPQGYLPEPCTWWEILDADGAATGLEFHVDVTEGMTLFHVDGTAPDIVIRIPPSYTVTVRKKIDDITQCSWFKVDDPATTPTPCSWWEILDPTTGEPTGWEFHVDDSTGDGLFHIDSVEPGPSPIPITHMLTAEKKIDDIEPCDWFKVIDPVGWTPEPCSWWKIVWPTEWADVIIHVDQTTIGWFHVDFVGAGIPTVRPPPWNVTAEPYEIIEPWYIKPPYPDYAPSGMPDFDQIQDKWGPAPGIFTWCGPVAVSNSLWWLDSEYESIMNPTPVPPPTISDSFDLVTSYNPGVWDDHDVKNVDPLVVNLAWYMDTDGIRSLDGHTGTRWTDMEIGISQYLIDQGVDDLFEVHSAEFPEFEWIEYEIERCQDVVLLLEFYQDLGQGEWMPLYDNPSLEFGHYVTSAGVNSSTFELLISDPIQDAFEKGATFGRSPMPHPYPHTPDVHNDTMYVSHDGYPVNLWMTPPPSPYGMIPVWELVGYPLTLGYDPSMHAFIRAAVVTSPLAVHDIAVTDLIACYGATIIHGGQNCYINVTVENQGTVDETFTLDVFWNTTNLIGSKVVPLIAGSTAIVPFTWNTSGLTEYDNYTLSAYATPVPGETDTADNLYVDGTVMIVHVGDVDPNRFVEIKDLLAIALAYGSYPGHPKYHPNLDINNDAFIDVKDILAAALEYGWTG